jgi:hypothetical protein
MIFTKSLIVDGSPLEIHYGFRIADLMKPQEDGSLRKESISFEIIEVHIGALVYICKNFKVLVKNQKIVCALNNVYEIFSRTDLQAEQAADRAIDSYVNDLYCE